MRRLALTAALALCLLAPASASADGWIGNIFQSPTGNIVCKYRAWTETLACGRWNDQRLVSMTSWGPAREGYRISGLDEERMHVLYYGQKYTTGGLRITCTSYYNGMRCINHAGHGFFISRTVLNHW